MKKINDLIFNLLSFIIPNRILNNNQGYMNWYNNNGIMKYHIGETIGLKLKNKQLKIDSIIKEFTEDKNYYLVELLIGSRMGQIEKHYKWGIEHNFKKINF